MNVSQIPMPAQPSSAYRSHPPHYPTQKGNPNGFSQPISNAPPFQGQPPFPQFQSNQNNRNFNGVGPQKQFMGQPDSNTLDINLKINVNNDGSISANTVDQPYQQMYPQQIIRPPPSSAQFPPFPGMMGPGMMAPGMMPRMMPPPNSYPFSNSPPQERPFSNQSQKSFDSRIQIEEEPIYCVICQEQYQQSERQNHILKHKRPHTESQNKIKKLVAHYNLDNQPVSRPIVEPEQYNIQYEPNNFIVEQEVKYNSPPPPPSQLQSSPPQQKPKMEEYGVDTSEGNSGQSVQYLTEPKTNQRLPQSYQSVNSSGRKIQPIHEQPEEYDESYRQPKSQSYNSVPPSSSPPPPTFEPEHIRLSDDGFQEVQKIQQSNYNSYKTIRQPKEGELYPMPNNSSPNIMPPVPPVPLQVSQFREPINAPVPVPVPVSQPLSQPLSQPAYRPVSQPIPQQIPQQVPQQIPQQQNSSVSKKPSQQLNQRVTLQNDIESNKDGEASEYRSGAIRERQYHEDDYDPRKEEKNSVLKDVAKGVAIAAVPTAVIAEGSNLLSQKVQKTSSNLNRASTVNQTPDVPVPVVPAPVVPVPVERKSSNGRADSYKTPDSVIQEQPNIEKKDIQNYSSQIPKQSYNSQKPVQNMKSSNISRSSAGKSETVPVPIANPNSALNKQNSKQQQVYQSNISNNNSSGKRQPRQSVEVQEDQHSVGDLRRSSTEYQNDRTMNESDYKNVQRKNSQEERSHKIDFKDYETYDPQDAKLPAQYRQSATHTRDYNPFDYDPKPIQPISEVPHIQQSDSQIQKKMSSAEKPQYKEANSREASPRESQASQQHLQPQGPRQSNSVRGSQTSERKYENSPHNSQINDIEQEKKKQANTPLRNSQFSNSSQNKGNQPNSQQRKVEEPQSPYNSELKKKDSSINSPSNSQINVKKSENKSSFGETYVVEPESEKLKNSEYLKLSSSNPRQFNANNSPNQKEPEHYDTIKEDSVKDKNEKPISNSNLNSVKSNISEKSSQKDSNLKNSRNSQNSQAPKKEQQIPFDDIVKEKTSNSIIKPSAQNPRVSENSVTEQYKPKPQQPLNILKNSLPPLPPVHKKKKIPRSVVNGWS